MANNQGNGRNVATPDENRPSWRPEDENGQRKILGLNAARVYDIDMAAARARFASDDLTWSRAARAAFQAESAG